MNQERKNNFPKHFSSKLLTLSLFLLFGFSVFLSSCKDKAIPRPYAYFRIALPEQNYQMTAAHFAPCRFEISDYAKIEAYNNKDESWFNLTYPALKGKIHCSYKTLNNNLQDLSEESRRFVYAHTGRADGIEELVFEHPENRVYAVLYNLKGNVASPVQFVLTDSVEHFLRGALYFEAVPNKDSIAPVLDYVRKDIIHLIESFEWEK